MPKAETFKKLLVLVDYTIFGHPGPGRMNAGHPRRNAAAAQNTPPPRAFTRYPPFSSYSPIGVLGARHMEYNRLRVRRTGPGASVAGSGIEPWCSLVVKFNLQNQNQNTSSKSHAGSRKLEPTQASSDSLPCAAWQPAPVLLRPSVPQSSPQLAAVDIPLAAHSGPHFKEGASPRKPRSVRGFH